MTMTNAEIVADCRQAENKRSQIRVLADLNNMDTATIKDILREAGEHLPGRRPSIDKAKAEALYRQGLTDKEIAEALGLPQGSIYSWRQRNSLPPNGTGPASPAPETEETVPLPGLSELCRRVEAILSALPAGSSEATRAAACDLARCLLWDEMVRHGTGPASNELWGHNSA